MTCHVISRLALLHKLDTCSHNMSCHLTSSHVLSRLVMSCHVMSRHVTSRHVTSCHVMSCHVISRLLTSCHSMSCHVMSRLVMSCHVMSCHLTSSHVLSRLVISCHLARESCSRICLPSLPSSSKMAAGWPGRGFRNRGPVRESGSERRSRCGAARTASVRVRRRAHFCDLGIVLRGRLRGSGMLEVCRGRAGGRAAALCRGDWVPGFFFLVTGASKTLAATGHQVRKTNYTSELMHGETLQAPLRTRSP